MANWLWTRKERVTAGIPFGFESYVFGPPGSGSELFVWFLPSTSKKFGKRLISTVDFFMKLLSLKTDVNVQTVSNKQKLRKKAYYFWHL